MEKLLLSRVSASGREFLYYALAVRFISLTFDPTSEYSSTKECVNHDVQMIQTIRINAHDMSHTIGFDDWQAKVLARLSMQKYLRCQNTFDWRIPRPLDVFLCLRILYRHTATKIS